MIMVEHNGIGAGIDSKKRRLNESYGRSTSV
jgi:hypothetical protein